MHTRKQTHVFFYMQEMLYAKNIENYICTVDTDVVVLAIAMIYQINPDELWLAFGTKAHFRYIPIHEVINEMDPIVCKTLPAFHAFTECDTVSAFGGRG